MEERIVTIEYELINKIIFHNKLVDNRRAREFGSNVCIAGVKDFHNKNGHNILGRSKID